MEDFGLRRRISGAGELDIVVEPASPDPRASSRA